MAPARTVAYDFKRAILARLRGYRLVVRQRGFNVEAPADKSFDVRLTLGDAAASATT